MRGVLLCNTYTMSALRLITNMQDLHARGHNVSQIKFGAVSQFVLINPDDGSLLAVSDPRKDGAPAGY